MVETSTNVTLAVLALKIDTLSAQLGEYMRNVERDVDDHETRLRRSERAITQMEQNQGLWGGALAALSLISSSIAAWFGSR